MDPPTLPCSQSTPAFPWVQAGITSVAVARAFLDALRHRDTLVLYSSDGDVGYPLTARGHRQRGHGASISPRIIAASPPPPELVAYHRALGLGPEHVYCPAAPSPATRLATLVLEDSRLLERIRADQTLRSMLFAFKDRSAELLLDRLGLVPNYCAPPAAVYEAANDKLAFARAGATYGFETLPMEVADDSHSLTRAFRSLRERYGQGCILRLRRGAGGSQAAGASPVHEPRHRAGSSARGLPSHRRGRARRCR